MQRSLCFFAFTIVLLYWSTSCTNKAAEGPVTMNLDSLYQSYPVKGCFALKSLKSGQLFVYNESRCRQSFLPASTFKIVNAITALETGVAPDEKFMIPWDSVTRSISSWNQDHTLASAFKVSCVPYYQALAEKIGVERMQSSVRTLQYGKMDVRPETLTNFWLKGQSRISPYEQLDFLERLVNEELPLKPSTYQRIRSIMMIGADPNGIVLSGKTGWAIMDSRNIGWFVGLVERPDGERFIFVNNVECKAGSIPDDVFMSCRKKITGEVLKRLQIVPSES